ncbi:DUF305 domain-containing protein [Streptomyces sp. MST-110588]|nr:DUF305 domain-containing protein [Streptomyces sp. MST-110588]
MTGAVAAGTLALTLALTACGDDGAKSGSPKASPSQSSARPSASGSFNDADVRFAQMMIPHHQQAVEMARLSGGRASDKEIKQLSQSIEKAQGPEIATMRGWLKSWGKPESAPMDHSGMPGMHHGSHGTGKGGDGEDEGSGSGMPGIMSEKDMADLKAAKGTAYDKKFAEMMTEHHNGAIAMAEDERKNGRDAAAKKLAGDIIKGQSAEVEKFKKILDRL